MKKLTKSKLQQRSKDRIAFLMEVREDHLRDELELIYTDSGVGYIVHQKGDGPQPNNGEKVEVHYVGILESKPIVFDETFSKKRGVRFILGTNKVISGWDLTIPLLNRGDQVTLFIPSKLGYGSKGRGQGIPSNSNLMFYIEIVE